MAVARVSAPSAPRVPGRIIFAPVPKKEDSIRRARFPLVASLAKVIGIAGSAWGLILTLVQANLLLGDQGPYSDYWPIIRNALVALALYGGSLFCVVRSQRRILTLIVVILAPLNVLALASVGLLLVPATVLLILATALLWLGGDASESIS